MSLLIYYFDTQAVNILTDTLSTTRAGEPLLLVSKAVVFPHLDLVVACTGVRELLSRWVAALSEKILCRDIDVLDRYAPEVLRGVYDELRNEIASDHAEQALTETSTIYHFGLSERRGEYVGYAYRSPGDFESEELPPGAGIGVKPEPLEMPTLTPTIDELVALACQVRAEQEALPPTERIRVGGDLVLVQMAGRAIATKRIHRFDGFEEAWLAMHEHT